MEAQFRKRRADLVTWMARNSIAVVMIEDTEGRRDPALRYFSGHPSDAILFITVTGHAVLCPWDVNMAERLADVELIVPYSEFGRHPVEAARTLASRIGVPPKSRVEIPSGTPYPLFLRYVEALFEYDVLCREDGGASAEISRMRSIKGVDELEFIELACSITDGIIDEIERAAAKGSIRTELDAALMIERLAREAEGGERTGFETLAAGPKRSYCIHPFPAYTDYEFPGPGLSILDFGVVVEGYTSDVTLTIASGELTAPQRKIVKLVERAYEAALELYRPGVTTREASLTVDEIFRKANKAMPHALGHGIGLEPHEGPAIRNRDDNGWVFEPGMVVTLEPGLYDPKHGGCRLENDVLITETGNRVLTHSRIIRI